MRNFIFIMLATCAILIGLSSCSTENDNSTTIVIPSQVIPYYYQKPTIIQPGSQNAAGEYAITFGNYSNGNNTKTAADESLKFGPMQTRAAAASVSGTGYDDLALYCWNSDEIVMNGFHVQWLETNWAYAGVDNQEVKFFKNQYPEYNFIGVIPYGIQATLSDGTLTVSGVKAFVQDNPWESASGSGIGTNTEDTPDEFLYCTANVQKSDYVNGAVLNFQHGNAKIYLKFKSDDPNTEIIDYKPEVGGTPAVPGGQQEVTAKIIDELAAGRIAAWPYLVESTLTSTQPNNYYPAPTNYGQLGDLVDVVNAQFDYFDAEGNPTTANWEKDVNVNNSKKNKIQFKLKSSVNVSDFVAGNDAFWNNASDQLKSIFQAAYNDGWRVIRVNAVSTGGYAAWLINNTQMTYTVNTPGTPAVPGIPGIDGIIMLPAKSTAGDGSDAVLDRYISVAAATINITNGLSYSAMEYANSLTFTTPSGKFNSQEVASPSVFYSIPGETENVGTVKVSYIYKGVKYYDSRVYIPADKCQWQAGKYYTYVINISGAGNGKTDGPGAENDPVVTPNNEIRVISVVISDYEEGTTEVIDIN